jgi:hypothetical protein
VIGFLRGLASSLNYKIMKFALFLIPWGFPLNRKSNKAAKNLHEHVIKVATTTNFANPCGIVLKLVAGCCQ